MLKSIDSAELVHFVRSGFRATMQYHLASLPEFMQESL